MADVNPNMGDMPAAEDVVEKVVEEAAKEAPEAVIVSPDAWDLDCILSCLQDKAVYVAAVFGVIVFFLLVKCICCRGASKKKKD